MNKLNKYLDIYLDKTGDWALPIIALCFIIISILTLYVFPYFLLR